MPIPMNFGLRESGPTPRRYAKELKRINLESALALGRHFHRVNLPRRFTVSGGRMLMYAVRSRRYLKMKKAKKGHSNPLDWSGRTKRAVLRTEDVRTSGTSARWAAQVILRARNLNRFQSERINPADEIRRVATKEEAPLARVFDKVHTGLREQIK